MQSEPKGGITMPKININGVAREMTAEEIAELERMQAQTPAPTPTAEDRLTDMENVADMAYINGELALAMLNEMEG